MARILRDFKCPACDKEFERFIDSDKTAVNCECGHLAQRMIGMPRVSLEGITGDFPGAHSKWAKIREDNARIKAKKGA